MSQSRIDARKEDLLKKCEEFLDSPSTCQEGISALKASLEAPTTYLDNIPQRIELPTDSGRSSKRGQNRWKQLASGKDKYHYNEPDFGIREGKAEKVQRSGSEITKCLRRDGQACIFTGVSNPQVCHIFPFASLESGYTESALESLGVIYRQKIVDRYQEITTSSRNIVDTAKNMISMNGILHSWWAKGKFALKPVTELENGVRVEFHWLQTAGKRVRDHVYLDTDPRNVLKDYSDIPGLGTMINFKTHRPILSGEMFEIISNDESAIPSFDMLKLQWDLLRMVSLNGAIDEPDEPDEESDSEEEDDESDGDEDRD
ncbi:hypothetical protein F4677DRAFT_459096 [Hypoxylon crocopeplum]|nr:hypothetical protein F4677DRAFT_459096 [Hypoxylon crocopeplum]